MVIELSGLILVEDIPDVYGESNSPDLSIKTHYESLDIAGSKKIFYLKFQLGQSVNFNNHTLLESLKEKEPYLPIS